MEPLKPFAQRLTDDLAVIEADYLDIVGRSALHNTDPNRYGSGVVFVGAAQWGWVDDDSLAAQRTRLLERFGEWLMLFELLHRSVLPATRKRIRTSTGLLERWLSRSKSDTSVPSTIECAVERTGAQFDELRPLIALAVHGDAETLGVPDTNSLLRQPDEFWNERQERPDRGGIPRSSEPA